MAKMDRAELTKQLLQLVLGMGMSAGSPAGAASVAMTNLLSGSGIKPGPSATADAFLAKNYPTEFAPDAYHKYDVDYVPGEANFNKAGKRYDDVITDAGRMQTMKEHNDAITKYVKMLPSNADPKMVRAALQRGLDEEKRLPQFWNESYSRLPFSVSSSAVTGIRMTPDARIEVQWKGKPTWYTFKQYPNTQLASMAAQALLKADSIGRAVYPVVSRKVKNPSPNLGYWNADNYDPAYK